MIIKYIDLFAGIGGMRLGFEKACQRMGLKAECVLASEIKRTAIQAYEDNFNEEVKGDITQIPACKIPEFNYLLAGFPCQSFSTAGKREGFSDTRGTLFFEIEEILDYHRPDGFLLENVDNLVNHDKGKTLEIIERKLSSLGYYVAWGVFNAKFFGVAQERKRIYIVGTKKAPVPLQDLHLVIERRDKQTKLKDILQTGLPVLEDKFSQNLVSKIPITQLPGKAIKDKRGGKNNIHSWELDWKGETTEEQKEIMNTLLKNRRWKKWADRKGIKWMDGMPLTLEEIETFYGEIEKKVEISDSRSLKQKLDDLVNKGYLRLEHPKDEIIEEKDGEFVKKRVFREDLPKGYNIVTGKLSFPISKILDQEDIAPALVATDMDKLAVVDGEGVRQLSVREGLRLFGFPEDYRLDLNPKKVYDLLGNTVVVPVIEEVSLKILEAGLKKYSSLSFQRELPVCS